ncbi:formate hydrogenlyase maturation HycH family protein [Photobacterium leiognathi]|uniref:formate hydrogenlyase maturation HycH family protein n=1 Tax=Photobacterium leiognathi TaxID=553611 RepID=UPI002738E877|nr:formate hydrogenlyase maturation HycH family protein [Photobacterium leiognathi]
MPNSKALDLPEALTQSRHLEQNVYFYNGSRKFVDESYDVPEEAKQIMYYSLAIGHHLGVVDCLDAA